MQIADSLRRCRQHIGADGALLLDVVGHHIQCLQGMRDNLVMYRARLARNAYQMDILVNTIILSGLLRDTHDIGEALDIAIELCVAEPSLKAYFKDLRRQPRSTMSSTTIKRHRLTLNMAFCALSHEVFEQMEGRGGSMVAWRTMDLSPGGGYEWLMHGVSLMLEADLPKAYALSERLLIRLDPGDEKLIQLELSDFLGLQQGVPCAVGSGCSSMKYKMHACFHAEKLKIKAWPGVAKAMNATVSYVGDLGEAKLTGVRCNLKAMFGEWITGNVGSGDFDFQDCSPRYFVDQLRCD